MAYADIDIEKLVEKTGSIFKLVILASKRAASLNEGAQKLVECDSKSNATVALEEIMQGKVSLKPKKEAK